MVKVKICGITNLDDALDAVEFGADALGFNFYRKSPRYVEPGEAKEILREIPPSIWKVGVFVNESEEVVQKISVTLGLDYLQFHGDETPYYCEQFVTPYWKAFRMKDQKGLDLMKKYRCEYYLVDTYIEKGYGGTGITGDWNLAEEAKKVGRIFLAGGLRPDNVELAIKVVRPDGVDVTSGVEDEPGKKNRFKLEEFITKAKGI